jgi:hypothetical protein
MVEGIRTVMGSTRYVQSMGSANCLTPDGQNRELPIISGILKHPRVEELPGLLANPKYILLALNGCAWPILRQFPRQLLNDHLPFATIREGRRRALEFLLAP